ncbi:hypothetical protein [Thermogemmatispora tikiterensis]|uniref:Uncharacterized protein n=1 Tax=Thermogemmatispora tikiterensis TaxID=1825093 RepID=A0A328VCU6_9CHLR|nr:hypothetical protein [Thermogemmatispora tikiterensis]RAQ94669.1 hypothetical protein A4R35_03920 [Thermogemmatispora tikiterensis]
MMTPTRRPNRGEALSKIPTRPLEGTLPGPGPRGSRKTSVLVGLFFGLLLLPLLVAGTALAWQLVARQQRPSVLLNEERLGERAEPIQPFDPNQGAILPHYRVVAFYGIPGAPATGPAYQLSAQMLARLQAQGAVYARLDPTHPVKLAIDLVASVPDRYPGPEQTYSHRLDPTTIAAYIRFCQQHNLLLFLDLSFGQAPVMQELHFFLPYLEHYSFVELAIDPEWMFPRHNGIPGINLSNVRASDLNPVIETLAALPMQYHVPRKILVIHQYRGDGDGLKNPYDASVAEFADKRNLLYDPRVDVVIHVDSVGGYRGDQQDKIRQYRMWVEEDMQKYHNFRYGGFKLFYHIEARTLMTPAQVLALQPPPMVISYGN